MSVWLAWARNGLIAWTALTLFAGATTQLLAAIFGYSARFGEPVATWYGHPLYDPWRFLSWGLGLAPVRPWIAFLCIVVAMTFVLAAFAMLVLARLIHPVELPRLALRHGFARWDMLRQQELLGANGLALGAVRRHWLAKPDIVSAPSGNVALVGDPEHTDSTLLAAISAWRGALVFVDVRGLAVKLSRKNVIRFAPRRGDTAGYNVMLAIRGGVHAWADACLLTQAFLQTGEGALTDAFAVLVLDQLLTAPLEHRNLTAVRRRLAQPYRVLADICATWGEQQCSAPAPRCEIARAVQAWRVHPNATLDSLAQIDTALALFADGAYGRATAAHQFRFADLVASDGPNTLIIAPTPGHAERAAPLIAAMLAQLVAECATTPDIDCLGRTKQRELLIAIDAGMSAALSAIPAGRPLLPGHAPRNGCRFLVQVRCVAQAPYAAFAATAAIGPQIKATAAKLSELGGSVRAWQRLQSSLPDWKEMVFPTWKRTSRPIVAPRDLVCTQSDDAFLFLTGLAPIHASAVRADVSKSNFTSGADLAPAAHDWTAPPLVRVEAAAPTPATSAPATAKPIGAQIRKALTRTAAPASHMKAKNP